MHISNSRVFASAKPTNFALGAMEATVFGQTRAYDRMQELTEFDETKAGVKGLVDSGIKEIPRIFIHAPENRPKPSDGQNVSGLQIPVIDLQSNRQEIVDRVRAASKTWGFFQLVNHGIPVTVLDDMIEATRRFHEQDREEKAKLYSRDPTKKVKWLCNFDLFKSPAANWRDTLGCSFDGALDPAELPSVCGKEFREFREQIVSLADTVCEVLSEGLGLDSYYLKRMQCTSKQYLYGHYYPPCPQPQLTIGTTKHGDPTFLTFVLQDDLGGLQVLHDDKWINVTPIHGALVVNIGDLLQLMSNDRFTSVEHRVLASSDEPRVSVAVFFHPSIDDERRYGPIGEVLSNGEAPLYKEILMREYINRYISKGLDGISALAPFKL